MISRRPMSIRRQRNHLMKSGRTDHDSSGLFRLFIKLIVEKVKGESGFPYLSVSVQKMQNKLTD